jgi:hypothetical protein
MPCPSVTLYLDFKLGIQFKPDQISALACARGNVCQICCEAVPQPRLIWVRVPRLLKGHVVDLLKEQTCPFISRFHVYHSLEYS